MELINGVNILQVPAAWRFAEHRHPGIEIVGILQGQVTLEAADTHWQPNASQIAVLPPDLPHKWNSEHGARLAIAHLFHVPRDLADRLLLGSYPRIISLSHTQFAEYTALFTRLVAIGDQVAPNQVRLLQAYLEAFLLVILDGQQEQDRSRAVTYEIAAYVQAHLGEPITIAQIAQNFFSIRDYPATPLSKHLWSYAQTISAEPAPFGGKIVVVYNPALHSGGGGTARFL